MVETELERLAAARAATLGLIAGLSQAELDAAPPGGGWSIGEVLDHLLRAEATNRGDLAALVALARSGREPYLRRSLEEFDIAPAFVPRFLLNLLSLPLSFATLLAPAALRESVVRSRAFPARAARVLEPRRGRPAGELRAALAASLAEMRALFAANSDLDFRRLVLQHPLLGANDALGVLRLTAAHELRHQDQIRDIRRRLGAAPAYTAS
ncbi:MAG TPA: DinB family protein [Thermoanaerobaculia bacterium]|nr:DinB family protein [Thermoanaerobaculia bacterium]